MCDGAAHLLTSNASLVFDRYCTTTPSQVQSCKADPKTMGLSIGLCAPAQYAFAFADIPGLQGCMTFDEVVNRRGGEWA